MTNKPDNHRTSPPDFLTVEEAAAVLRIGRTSAYRQARRYLATKGAEGLCAYRFGKQIRIPRCHLGATRRTDHLADLHRRRPSRVTSRVDHARANRQARYPTRYSATRPRRLALLRVTAMTPIQIPRTTDSSKTDECTETRVSGGVW